MEFLRKSSLALSLARAALLECRTTARIFGPWLPGCCLLACVGTWLQEPLFFRDYGIHLLWDGGAAVSQLATPLVALVWCANRSGASGWHRIGRCDPVVTVASGGIGLLAYGAFLAILTLTATLLLESSYGVFTGVGKVPGRLVAWLLPALPLCFFAPGIAFLQVRPTTTLFLLLAAAAACLGITPPRYDNSVPLAMVAASAAAAIGSILLSIWLVRVTR